MDVIRTLRTADLMEIRRHLLALSSADRFRRFHSFRTDEAILRDLHAVDWEGTGSLGWFRDRKLRGLLQLGPVANPAAGETNAIAATVSVDAAFRGRGIATALLAEARIQARARGIERIDLPVGAGNRPMLRLLLWLGARLDPVSGLASLKVAHEAPQALFGGLVPVARAS